MAPGGRHGRQGHHWLLLNRKMRLLVICKSNDLTRLCKSVGAYHFMAESGVDGRDLTWPCRKGLGGVRSGRYSPPLVGKRRDCPGHGSRLDIGSFLRQVSE